MEDLIFCHRKHGMYTGRITKKRSAAMRPISNKLDKHESLKKLVVVCSLLKAISRLVTKGAENRNMNT